MTEAAEWLAARRRRPWMAGANSPGNELRRSYSLAAQAHRLHRRIGSSREDHRRGRVRLSRSWGEIKRDKQMLQSGDGVWQGLRSGEGENGVARDGNAVHHHVLNSAVFDVQRIRAGGADVGPQARRGAEVNRPSIDNYLWIARGIGS